MNEKIGYLGPKGTFTKMAVDGLFHEGEKIEYKTIPACIDALNDDEVDVAVVPLENAIEGSVHITLDYLIHHVEVPIVAEIVLPIQQQLLVHPSFKGNLSDIKMVYSHTQAIAQCHQFIHRNLPNATIKDMSSTAEAAQFIMESNGEPVAAIGNKLAVSEYGLNILQESVHDYPNNHTRFAVLKKEKRSLPNVNITPQGEKTTVLVTLPRDYAGALHQVLSAFSWRKMNLSKIESRPMKTGLGNYFFIIDVNQPYDQVLFPGVQSELEALGCKTRILGSYSTYTLSEQMLKKVSVS
ncbi:prephenate dehydratase [Salirhabdus salicampi]|uniref:prephenate dehydratase n=1 Tax=Salirhabdus salicampi TaxID=476102 RepID=UPI0020C317CA|nr:prephenate dehydratase [Salirhabdus salicampi]